MSYPQQHPVNVVVYQQPSNGLGLAGFIVSLISFFTCGLSSPIGLLLSLFGLLWAPRGFAVTGVVLGGIGSAWLVLSSLAILAGLVGIGAGLEEANKEMKHKRREKAAATAPADDGMIQLEPAKEESSEPK